MTLGAHLQELRKAAGLSQEALGEKLGVSRQSISKWESDLAMPEVEKLIALSKLFGVTLGHLLQVEEENQGAGELSDRELQSVELISARYLKEREGMRRKWALPMMGAGGALLAVVLLSLLLQVGELKRGMADVHAGVSSAINSAAWQGENLRAELENMLNQRENGIMDWDFHLSRPDPLAGTFYLSLNATLAEATPATGVHLLAEWEGEQALFPMEARAGTSYSVADVALVLSDEIKLSIVTMEGETQKTVSITTLEGVKSGTALKMGENGSSYKLNLRGTVLSWSGKTGISIVASEPYDGTILTPGEWLNQPQRLEARLYLNGEAVKILPVKLDKTTDSEPPPAPNRAEVYSTFFLYPYETVTVKDGDEIHITFFCVDKYGREMEYLVERTEIHSYANGLRAIKMEEDRMLDQPLCGE